MYKYIIKNNKNNENLFYINKNMECLIVIKIDIFSMQQFIFYLLRYIYLET